MRYILLGVLLIGMGTRVLAVSVSLDWCVCQAACNNPIGALHITAAGGTPPYTYSWSDGPTVEDREGIAPGDYTVTVTDDLGATVSATWSILGSPWLIVGITQAESMPCPNEANGSAILIVSEFSGLEPYDITVLNNGVPVTSSGVDQWGNPMYAGFALGDVIETSATDALGCAGGQTQVIYGPEDTPVTITDIQGECVGTLGNVYVSAPFAWRTDISVWNDQGQSVYHEAGFMSGGTVGGLAAGNYTLKQTWSGIYMEPCDTLYFPFTVPYMGALCGTVNGTSWYDVDGDCSEDIDEVGIPYNALLIEPGNEAVLTNGAGNFSFPMANGAYTLVQTDPTLVPICPVVQPVQLTVNSNITTVDFANGSTEPLDLAAYGGSGGAQPGFNFSVNATVRNLSPQLSDPVSVSITFDPLLTLVYATPTPTSVMGNVVTWDFAAFTSFQDEDVQVILNVPIGTPLGTVLTFSAQASNTLPEGSLANNSIAWNTVVVGSFDPNDKLARTSTGASASLYHIDEDEWIDYTIRFQNTGTAAATFVVITDTLSADLDMLTFEQGTASHSFEVCFKPGRVVEWRFDNINLPDSATDETGSHGLVSFRIRPVQPVLAGTVLENKANIYFDYNDPVITEPSVLVAEFSTGMSRLGSARIVIVPNPTPGPIRVVCDGCALIQASYLVMGGDGRAVQRGSLRSWSDEIDITGLDDGSYVLHLTTPGGSMAQPFIKSSIP